MTPTQTISLYHPLLEGIAMRIVKCKADAEDIVQDTFLKWLSIDTKKIENTKAYLIRSVTNNCINHLKTLKKKKEEYLEGINFPDILGKFKELDLSHIDLQADLQAALSVLYSKLEPLERAVYVLREVFNFDYEALQEVLEKKKEHCRQLFSRAKKKLGDSSHPVQIDGSKVPQWFESFKKTCEIGFSGDLIEDLKK